MQNTDLIMALDQGTTSSRALVFDRQANLIASAQRSFTQHYPENGWVEHDPEDIWNTILETARAALQQVQTDGRGEVVTIGITNQRETTLIWNRETSIPIAPAIVWQDRRTAQQCRALAEAGHAPLVQARTGLRLDPYFSASKVTWLLDHVPGARALAEAGKLAFGTVDTFLLWRLTGGRVHASDETNAARTSLLNIHTGEWDEDLLTLFNVPRAILPQVKPSAADFGMTDPRLFGRALPIQAMAGDQQSAAFGQGCTQPGQVKSTYGTGCFVLMNTGAKAVTSNNRLLTTRACRTSADPAPVFALEGSIFMAGAIVQWLRDELKVITEGPQTEAIAARLKDNGGVYLVPAFTGLGAPHWDADARAAIYGLTRQSGRDHIIRAALEAVAYQTHDLITALTADAGNIAAVRVDGGMAANRWLMQFIADITATHLQRPSNLETTALGVAYLAGLQAGIWPNLDALPNASQTDQTFTPNMPQSQRQDLLNEWNIAVKTTRYRASLQQRQT